MEQKNHMVKDICLHLKRLLYFDCFFKYRTFTKQTKHYFSFTNFIFLNSDLEKQTQSKKAQRYSDLFRCKNLPKENNWSINPFQNQFKVNVALFHGSQQSSHFFRIELCSHKTKTRYEYKYKIPSVGSLKRMHSIKQEVCVCGGGPQNQKAILQFYLDSYSLSNPL